MVGVGAALRPEPVAVLPAVAADAALAAWRTVLEDAASGRPALLLGGRPCDCDAEARLTIVDWARAENLTLIESEALAGIALAGADGELRYAGDPAALTVHCGGLRGFRAWWAAPAARPIVTAPCACA